MRSVELLYLADCPNIAAAREQLRRALEEAKLPPRWSEHDVASPDAPLRVRGFGSPTILVDGRDVMEMAPGDGPACRLYAGSDRRGAPPLDAIVTALRVSSSRNEAGGRLGSFAVLPGAILSVLPVVACPSCWPLYAGALSALGVPFLMESSWLAPVTACALLLALAGLGFRAPRRRGFGPFFLGTAAASMILLGKFAVESDAVLYLGTALLVVASAWNGWPKPSAPACATCASSATAEPRPNR